MLDRTATYWAIAPCNLEVGERILSRVWDFDIVHGSIAIGWDRIRGDIGAMNAKTLQLEMDRAYPGSPNGGWRSLWAFYHRIQVGDYVVSRTGRSTALGLGRVTGPAYRDDARARERSGELHQWDWPHFRDIEWISTRDEFFDHYVFSIPTVVRLVTHLDEVLRRYDDAGH